MYNVDTSYDIKYITAKYWGTQGRPQAGDTLDIAFQFLGRTLFMHGVWHRDSFSVFST